MTKAKASRRKLTPEDEKCIREHFDKLTEEKQASEAAYKPGDLVTFTPGDREAPKRPGVIQKVTGSIYGEVYWVELDGGAKVHTLAGRLRKRKAFTLIELLVVIAIVAMLLSFYLPALAKSREATRLNTCTSNLVQIRAAMMSYVDFYQDVMIWNEYPEDTQRWAVEPTQGVWVCPSDPDRGVNRRGGLTSYDASGFRNAMYYATDPRRPSAVQQSDNAPHLLALAWDYQPVHFKKRNRVFATERPRLVP